MDARSSLPPGAPARRPGLLMAAGALALATFLPGLARAAGSAPACATPAVALTAEQAARDVRVLQRALKALHPALTKYRTPEEMDAAFARFEVRGKAARTVTEMYLAATELAAAIRCGHTWTNVRNQSGATRAALLDAADKLPLLVTLVEGRWLVLASVDPTVAAGDELTAVNGTPTAQLVARLLPYLRADGSSDGKRLRQLGHDRDDYSQVDILLPLLSPPAAGRYRLGLRLRDGAAAEVSVAACTLASREELLRRQGRPAVEDRWSFEVRDQVGYLVLPTFSFWNSTFDWAAFLDGAFAELAARQVPTLVIDLRANEGGDGAIGNALLSHLITRPLGYFPSQSVTTYERVPYELARFLDTWDYGFFDRTGDVEPITEGTAAGKFQLRSRPYAQRFIQPGPRAYAGTTYALVGAENSSATFVLADLLQRSGVARLVGQATGGNQRGLNGGQLAWVVLPSSGVAVDIPLLAARYSVDTPDASVTPDVPVKRTFEAQAAGVDQELEAVRRLVGKQGR
jgi:hypothetical protein